MGLFSILSKLTTELMWLNWGLRAVTHSSKVLAKGDAQEINGALKYLITFGTFLILSGPFDVFVGPFLPFYELLKIYTISKCLSLNSRAPELVFNYLFEPFVLPLMTEVEREISLSNALNKISEASLGYFGNQEGQLTLMASIINKVPSLIRRPMLKFDAIVSTGFLKLASKFSRIGWLFRGSMNELAARLPPIIEDVSMDQEEVVPPENSTHDSSEKLGPKRKAASRYPRKGKAARME